MHWHCLSMPVVSFHYRIVSQSACKHLSKSICCCCRWIDPICPWMTDSTVCPLGHDFTSQFGVFHYMLNHYWFIHWTLKLPLLSHFGCVSFNGNHLFTHYSWYSSKLVLLKNMQSCRRFLWALCWMFFLWEFITFICFCMLLYAFRVLLKSTQVFRLMIFLKINKKHLKKLFWIKC